MDFVGLESAGCSFCLQSAARYRGFSGELGQLVIVAARGVLWHSLLGPPAGGFGTEHEEDNSAPQPS